MDGLIQVLDRRKFCLARESKSGLGLTPLHTAVLYEQFDVFEYLVAKFPETLKLIDYNGWTPLDYAPFMPDKTFLDKLLDTENYFEVRLLFTLTSSLSYFYGRNLVTII